MSLFTSLLTVTVLLAGARVEDLPNPRAAKSWVSDTAHVLNVETMDNLDHRLGALERDLGVEVAVATVDHVDTSPKEFATALFQRWGVGKAGANNGLLVLLVMDQHRLEMETGYGLEGVLPDGWLGQMQQEVMVPRFKEKAFGAGLVAGLERVETRLRSMPEEVRATNAATPMNAVARTYRRHPKTVAGVSLLGGLMAVAGGVALQRRRRRKREERTCLKCKGPMQLLPESSEDRFLTPAQQLEEKLKSVLYDVMWCPPCRTAKVIARDQAGSSYAPCSKCRSKTVHTTREIILSPTYATEGRERLTRTCRNCKDERVVEMAIPAVPEPVATATYDSYSGSSSSEPTSSFDSSSSSSSDSSSSSSDFGGGSSGGGGSGSDW